MRLLAGSLSVKMSALAVEGLRLPLPLRRHTARLFAAHAMRARKGQAVALELKQ